MIEHRAYHTCHGLWRYFTVDDGQIDLDTKDYICIGTLESYESTKAYFGQDRLLPVLIELDDGARLQRALDRERKQEQPKYEEMCRRFLADSEDFRRSGLPMRVSGSVFSMRISRPAWRRSGHICGRICKRKPGVRMREGRQAYGY